MRIAALVAALCVAAPLSAQQEVGGTGLAAWSSRPIVTAGAQGKAQITPDRAVISIGVETRDKTAAKAGAENARRQQGVIDTLKSLGIGDQSISTVNYTVYPQQHYDPAKGDSVPRIVGYSVSNTIRVEIRKLEQLGVVIDAALGKGANSISSLDFYSSNEDDARRTALAAAVQRARGDANAMAGGAGGHLGNLIDLSSQSTSTPRPMPVAFEASVRAQVTPIVPGEQTITVSVVGRWQFVPNTK